MKSNYSRHFIIACICATAALGSKTAAARPGPTPCSLKAPLSGASRSSVYGLGDDAFYSRMGPGSGKQFATLTVKKLSGG